MNREYKVYYYNPHRCEIQFVGYPTRFQLEKIAGKWHCGKFSAYSVEQMAITLSVNVCNKKPLPVKEEVAP